MNIYPCEKLDMLKNIFQTVVKLMKSVITRAFILLLLLPYIVAFTPNPEDSSSTTVQLAVGKGSFTYFNRDCHGPKNIVEVPFEDAAILIDHYEPPMRFGVKGGIIQTQRGEKSFFSVLPVEMERVEYINPGIGLSTQYMGIDVGLISILNKEYKHPEVILNGGLRIGNRDGFYFSSGYLNNVPLISGGCLYDVGFGLNLGDSRTQLWGGLGFQPDDGAMLSLKSQFPFTENLSLNVKGQYGLGEMKEYGLSLGTTIQF
jgi:hypothetical protein